MSAVAKVNKAKQRLRRGEITEEQYLDYLKKMGPKLSSRNIRKAGLVKQGIQKLPSRRVNHKVNWKEGWVTKVGKFFAKKKQEPAKDKA